MTTRVLYQIARADFLERVRGYKFLVILGSMVVVAYLFVPVAGANYVTIDLAGYRGVYNSAWIGASVALLVAGYLGLVSFFAIKGAVNRDRDTGVGQIIAATSVGKRSYILGKWLSNVAVLTAMTVVIVIAAGALQLIRDEDRTIDVWVLVAPFLVIVLPTMALVAAVALLFEAIPALRGGAGNVVFFIGWIIIGFPLALAGSFVLQNMEDGALAAIPGYPGGSNCCLILESNAMEVLGRELGTQQTFVWEGMEWTATNVLFHLALVGIALIVVLAAARIFDRFASTGGSPGRLASLAARAQRLLPTPWARGDQVDDTPDGQGSETDDTPGRSVQLTPLDASPTGLRFGRMLSAELRLALKGLQWWWYLVAVGLVVAGLALPLEDGQRWVLPLAWVWPVLIWSGMGVRELEHHTDQLVFSVSHPLRRQLPVTWLTGLIVALLAGSGVLARMLLETDGDAVFTWTVGALFIPSLALALGVWSGSSKLFQLTYLVLWYAGPMQGIQRFDFMGLDSAEAVADGTSVAFFAAVVVLLALAAAGRRRQLRS
jgi:hypothetical protein